MVKIKFKKRVIPKRQRRSMKLLGYPITKRRPMSVIKGYSKLRFADSVSIPKPTSVSLFSPSMNRPVAAFWGDKDKDGVYNGLDCQPRNKYKQGPQHNPKILKDWNDIIYNSKELKERIEHAEKRNAEIISGKTSYEGSEIDFKNNQKYSRINKGRLMLIENKKIDDDLKKDIEADDLRQVKDWDEEMELEDQGHFLDPSLQTSKQREQAYKADMKLKDED